MIVEVAGSITEKYGKQLTTAARLASIGKKPLESWQATIDTLELEGATAQQLYDESQPKLQARFPPPPWAYLYTDTECHLFWTS